MMRMLLFLHPPTAQPARTGTTSGSRTRRRRIPRWMHAYTQVLEAQEFIVKDANGNVRARLGAYTAGASLTLYHEAGRATLMASGGRGQGAHLSLADGTGKIKGLLLLSQEAA